MDATQTPPAHGTAPKVATARAKRKPGRPPKAAAQQQPRDAFGNEAPKPRAGRPVERRDMRPGQAVGRDGSVITRRRDVGEGITSEFDIPDELRDPNWELQAVRASVFGKPDPQNINAAYAAGFRPVSRKNYPGIFPDLQGDTIERDGLILMERPVELMREALAEQRGAAVELRQAQSEAFGERKLPKGFERGGRSADGKFDASRKLKRDHEVGTGNAYMPQREYAGPGDD